MKPKADLPIVSFASRDEWRAWLDAEHVTSSGVWLVTDHTRTAAPPVASPECRT